MLCNIPSCLASVAVGAAAGALEDYLAATSKRVTRGAVAGSNNRMAEFPTIQLRVAEAAASTDAARELLLRDLRDRAATVRAGSRCRSRTGSSAVAGRRLRSRSPSAPAKHSMPRPAGRGSILSNPVQRAWRDANAVGRHISMNWDAVGTMYGQMALGSRASRTILKTDKRRITMQGKIALEEHFAIPDTLMDSAGFVPESYWPELKEPPARHSGQAACGRWTSTASR